MPPHWCQLKPESLDKCRFYHSPDPPKSPPPPSPPQGGKGDFDRTLVPPFLRGARGDLDLRVKQQSLTGFELKLTPMRPPLQELGFNVPQSKDEIAPYQSDLLDTKSEQFPKALTQNGLDNHSPAIYLLLPVRGQSKPQYLPPSTQQILT